MQAMAACAFRSAFRRNTGCTLRSCSVGDRRSKLIRVRFVLNCSFGDSESRVGGCLSWTRSGRYGGPISGKAVRSRGPAGTCPCRGAVRKVLRPRATAVHQLLREGTGVLESPYCQGQFASLRHEVQLMGPVLFKAGLSDGCQNLLLGAQTVNPEIATNVRSRIARHFFSLRRRRCAAFAIFIRGGAAFNARYAKKKGNRQRFAQYSR